MITEELKNFIKVSLQQGKTSEEIKNILRQGGGWNEQDLTEAFSFTAKSSGIFLRILIPIIVIGLVGGGYFFYKTKIEKQNVIATTVAPTTQEVTTTNATVVAPVQDTTSPLVSNNVAIKDCGTSRETPMLDAGYESTYKNDTALKCFGESALSCTNAKITIREGNPLDKFPAILQVLNNNGVCSFKFTGYQQKYNQCPLSSVKEIDFTKSNLNLSVPKLVFKDINKNDSERYTAIIFYAGSFTLPNTNDEFKKNGCTGDLSKTMSSLMNTARIKATETQIQSDIHDAIINLRMSYDEQAKSDYTGVCLNDLKPALDKLKKLSSKPVTCFDSVDAFAISVSSPTSGFLCEDITTSSYPAKNITKNIIGPQCQ